MEIGAERAAMWGSGRVGLGGEGGNVAQRERREEGWREGNMVISRS